MGLSNSILAPSQNLPEHLWHAIPLELKLDIFKCLDRTSLDTCQLVSRDLKQFIDDNSHILGKHVVIKFFIQSNGKVSLLWKVDKSRKFMQKHGDTLLTHRDLMNAHVLQLEIAELDDEKVNLLEQILKECGDSLIIRSLRVCLTLSGAFSVVALRKLWPYLSHQVVQSAETNLRILNEEVSRLALTTSSITRAESCTKFFNLELVVFQDSLHQLAQILNDRGVEYRNREVLTLKFNGQILPYIELVFQIFTTHPDPSFLFHRTIIRTIRVDEQMVKEFALAHNFSLDDNGITLFRRDDGFSLDIFRSQTNTIVFHIRSNQENDECTRCKHYFSFNIDGH